VRALACLAAPSLPSQLVRSQDPERYWTSLRRSQFLLADDFAYLNTGTLGVMPKSVLQRTDESLLRSARIGFGAIDRWGAPLEPGNARRFSELRASLARTFNCGFDEITLTHNTTEGLAMVANGLDLSPEDEVLITDQEHPANIDCWQNRLGGAPRLRRVVIPLPPPENADLVERFSQAIGPRTRVVSFAAITTRTGLRLPVAEIVAMARRRGLVTVVDGAHVPGQIKLDLDALKCDFLAASPHKWMFAPAGSGLLYGRKDRLQHLAIRLHRFPSSGLSPADVLMRVGTNSGAIFDGYGAALEFYNALGPQAIHTRICELAQRVRAAAQRLKDVVMYTPDRTDAYAGMVAFAIEGVEFATLAPRLRSHGIRVEVGHGMRVSTHIHTRPQDIDRLFEVINDGMRTPRR